MGIDYMIGYDSEPKRAFTIAGLMGRLKSRERAQTIIELYRRQGDMRSPEFMGFEMVRHTADGTEETETIVIQDLLDLAEELKPYESYCVGCPANRSETSFGCIGSINYPLSAESERWLLDQLPDNSHPLTFMLLQKAVRAMGYTGDAASPLRVQQGVFLESPVSLERRIGDFSISGNQVFELLFLSGPIKPAHAALLLQFFGGISPNLDADVMMQLATPPSQDWINDHVPFLHRVAAGDDASIVSLKQFFQALYLAYRLDVPVLLDV